MEQWVVEEFAGADLGDQRRVRRAMTLVSQWAERPESSIPAACASKAGSKAAYRFLSNEAIAASALREAHRQATARRAAEERERILVAQDTTNLDFTGQAAIAGLGILDSVHARGLKVHSALALTSGGVPLGLLHQEVWSRDEAAKKRSRRRTRETAEKESQRWGSTVAACEQALSPRVVAWIVGDRESDLYDLFAAPRREGIELLVRAAQNRKVTHAGELGSLWEAVLSTPVRALHTISVPRGKAGQAEREALLEVRYTALELQVPRHAKQRSGKRPIPLRAVHVREVGAPAGQAPLEWMLLSTAEIHSLEDALACVEAYRQRWKVERYHYVLKSGCRIEALQLETASRIERALALYTVVAWRLLWLTYQAREEPEAPCTVALEEAEWRALYLQKQRRAPPEQPPPLRQAVRWIAELGGFVGTSKQEPGVKVLWRGWRRLQDITHTYCLLQHVGKG